MSGYHFSPWHFFSHTLLLWITCGMDMDIPSHLLDEPGLQSRFPFLFLYPDFFHYCVNFPQDVDWKYCTVKGPITGLRCLSPSVLSITDIWAYSVSYKRRFEITGHVSLKYLDRNATEYYQKLASFCRLGGC